MTKYDSTPEKEQTIKSLTVNELQVLLLIIEGLYAEPGFSDITIEDIASQAVIPPQVAGGIISSLVKKGVIWVEEFEANFNPPMYFYHLKEDYYYLHASWYAEVKEVSQ